MSLLINLFSDHHLIAMWFALFSFLFLLFSEIIILLQTILDLYFPKQSKNPVKSADSSMKFHGQSIRTRHLTLTFQIKVEPALVIQNDNSKAASKTTNQQCAENHPNFPSSHGFRTILIPIQRASATTLTPPKTHSQACHLLAWSVLLAMVTASNKGMRTQQTHRFSFILFRACEVCAVCHGRKCIQCNETGFASLPYGECSDCKGSGYCSAPFVRFMGRSPCLHCKGYGVAQRYCHL